MKKHSPCVFGRKILNGLMDKNMRQSELIEAVKADTGLFIDSGYMGKILVGQRTPPKIIESIKRILDINE